MKLSHSVIWIATVIIATSLTTGCNRNETSDASKTFDTAAKNASSNVDQVAGEVKQDVKSVGAAIDDAAITAKVKAAIVKEPDLSALQIEVDTAGGVVTLSGSVDSATKLQRATEVAQRVDGVKSVENRLSLSTS